MGLLSVPVDPVPARTKIDLQLHQPYRTWLGFGHLRCDWCGEHWNRHGCPARESAARLFLYTATKPQRAAALASGDITESDLDLRRRPPVRHRRKPIFHSLAQRLAAHPAPPNPLAGLALELEAATR